jgi:hypothetical protein
MGSDKDKAVDFILVRTMTPRQVVRLLLSRFPTTRDLVCPDEDCFELPIIVYDSFARIVIERSDAFLRLLHYPLDKSGRRERAHQIAPPSKTEITFGLGFRSDRPQLSLRSTHRNSG